MGDSVVLLGAGYLGGRRWIFHDKSVSNPQPPLLFAVLFRSTSGPFYFRFGTFTFRCLRAPPQKSMNTRRQDKVVQQGNSSIDGKWTENSWVREQVGLRATPRHPQMGAVGATRTDGDTALETFQGGLRRSGACYRNYNNHQVCTRQRGDKSATTTSPRLRGPWFLACVRRG